MVGLAQKSTSELILLNWFSGELVSGELVSGELVSGELVSGELVSGELVSGELVSGELVSCESASCFPNLATKFRASLIAKPLNRTSAAVSSCQVGGFGSGHHFAFFDFPLTSQLCDILVVFFQDFVDRRFKRQQQELSIHRFT